MDQLDRTIVVALARNARMSLKELAATVGLASPSVAERVKRLEERRLITGYTVVASTGRMEEAEHLKALGATTVIDRAELSAPGKAIGKERWAGVVDAVGSHTLANACATTKYGGAVAACGSSKTSANCSTKSPAPGRLWRESPRRRFLGPATPRTPPD